MRLPPCLPAIALLSLAGCDKSGPLANLDASSTTATPTDGAAASSSSSATATIVDAGRAMPPRPVPSGVTTVTIRMPLETQLKSIEYMEAMKAPQPNDAPADPDFAKDIADRLRPVGKSEVISSGRQIDVTLPKGCDATLPKQAIARFTGASLTSLLAHGVLVVRCADRELQCYQSTRNVDDVLCTHK
jgi:hypothetical protein